jgi:type IV secretory pathway TraG/TraD family ATPase VirD4
MNDFVEGENFLRGTCLIKQNRTMPLLLKLAHSENAQSQKGEIKICNAAFLPYPKENQHLLIVGSPGSGKTQITYPIVEQVIARGDKAIIWDIKGTYIQALAGKEGIELLAPWDKRSLRWLPCLDILRPLDCQRAASVIIPANPRDPQPYFANAGRQILEAVLIHLNAQDKDWGWHDVWDAISRGKNHLIEILKQTADGRSVAALIEGDSKAGQDVYSTLIASTQNIRWLAKAWPNEGISLNRWLKSETGQRALILGGVPEYEDLSLSSANLAVQTIVSQILSLPDDPRRRIWLFLDELATLGKMDSLLQAFALGRSKGLCVVAGIQDIGKIEHLYSRELAKSIANTFATTIFLRCSDADTSRWASSVIGEMEVKELLHGERYSLRDGILKATFFPEETKHEAFRSKPVFMPSQIANFPNLAGALRVSGWPVAYLQWPFKPIPQDEALIEPADWLNQKAEIKPVSKPIIPKPDQPQSVEKDSSDASWRLHNDVA